MKEFEKFISVFVKTQFPQNYIEEGPVLIDFLTKYYEWMEDQNNLLYKNRRLLEYRDIDKTLDEYIKNFKRKYLVNLPDTLTTNKRQFIKFILDFYRAKGTERGLQIFFKAIYDASIEVYEPNKDILRASDSYWKIEKYLEVSDSLLLSSFVGKTITTSSGSATAIVDRYDVVTTDNRIVNVLYISNINGTFNFGEKINLSSNTDFSTAPQITGSLTYINLDTNTRGSGYSVGDIVNITSTNGKGAKGVISSISDQTNGVVNFNIVSGGDGYTLDAVVSVSGGGGSGATFAVGSLSDTTTVFLYTDVITPYLSTALNGTYNFPKFPSANLATPINTALSSNTYTYGKIASLANINKGSGYSSNPVVTVVDPVISSLSIPDGLGNVLGNNAIIDGDAEIATLGVVKTVKVIDSGLGYVDGETVTMTGYLPVNNNQIIGTGYMLQQGKKEGRWVTDNSTLDSDKYIQDSRYYQKYSYELKTNIPETNYRDVILNNMHPAGMAFFAKFSSIRDFDSSSTIVTASISN